MIATLAEVVVGGAHPWSVAALKGRVYLVVLGIDAAIVTHLDHARGLGILEHGMFAGQLLDDLVDGGFHPEQGTAFDAGAWLFLMQHGL